MRIARFPAGSRFFNLERTAALAVLAIVCWQLFVPPALGLADNGDFARLIVAFDLTHASTDWGDRYFGFFDRHYVVNAVEARKYAPSDFVSSEFVFMAAALATNKLLSMSSFDLLQLGAVHVAVFVAGAYFLLCASKAFAGAVRTTAIILGSVVFTDIAYIAYFNSFYSESATFLFFLITAACAYGAISSDRHRIAWTAAYALAFTAFLLAKYQNLILLPVFLVFGGLLVKRWGESRYFQAYLVLALAACYGGYRFYISSPAVIDDAVLYNSVFNGILVDSPTPQSDLAALGLDPALAKYAGSTAFQPDSPRFNAEFLRKFRESVTIGGVFQFYIERPARLIAALNRTVQLTSQLRPKLGDYEKAAGHAPGSQSHSWAMWSSIRSGVLTSNLVFVLAIGTLYLALLARKWLRDRGRAARLNVEWLALIVVMAMAQLLVISVSDGISDMIKHAFLFNLLFDIMLVAMGAQVLTLLAGTRVTKETKKEGSA